MILEGLVYYMNNLTIVILTRNEEENIIDVISNAYKIANTVLIIDSGSTDKTVEFAHKNKAKVIFREWDNDFSAQRNFALKYVETEWVLYLDADERLNDELINSIKIAINKKNDKQYLLKRKSVAFGKEFNYGVLKPDFVPRLFKKDTVSWVNKVHEKPICECKEEVLGGYIKHYTYRDWHQYFNKFNQYTTIWAENAYEKNKKASFSQALLHGFFGFINMAILKKGILDGYLGVILAINHFVYTMMKYVKLIDLQRKDFKK